MNSTTNGTSCYFIASSASFSYVHGYEWSFVISIVLNCILSVICCVGNAIVLVTIWINPILHTPSNCLLFSLAVSDLAVGLIVQPLCVVYKMSELLELFDVFCFSGMSCEILGMVFSATAFFTIVVISVDRFLAVYLHLRYQEFVPVDRIIKVIIALWVLGFLFGIGRLTANHIIKWSILFSIFVSVFVVCALVTIVCYTKIWIIVRRHLKVQVHPISPETTSTTCTQSGAFTTQTTATNVVDGAQFQQKKKSVVTMLYVLGAFVACYVPYVCALFVSDLVLKWKPSSYALLNLIFPIVCLNSAVNPLVYFWRMSDLRQKAEKTIRKLRCYGNNA